ncbi:adaptin N terminal region-domain-containing protein [Scenedesmus sp. NREL 46B-D3]|nr:adaptin N terminal region-domain-containing protein [Scenedesmus sp. NREL 46B-D3]
MSKPRGPTKPRGEYAELSAQLQGLCMTGKRSNLELRQAKKEAFKKVINYMTLGMDMAGLFPMMTSCANLSPDDVVLKKMLYLYITHYAASTPDLALLTINQLHKDCQDQDPTVRGLALRSLCSLRIPNLLEYVVTPVTAGLDDRHPYVRRTAVMGVLKIWHMNPDIVEAQGLLQHVQQLLGQDGDPQVAANCLTLLLQVKGVKRLASNKALMYSLINKIKELSDWAQCQVLELVAHYTPGSDAEVYDLLNALEDRLGVNNSAVVLATIKVFLYLTLSMTATHQQVLERVKEQLKSLISREDPAAVYAVLCHARLLVGRAPMIFEGDYMAFYCRSHDSWYVKQLKMEILTLIASASNVYDIVGELTEYTRDISPDTARQAVKAVGRIALSVADVNGIVERLLLFLESGYDHIVAETLVQLKDLLRRYPDLGEVFSMGDIRPSGVADPEARAALVWILGHFGQHIDTAPYLLQPLAEAFGGEPPQVKLALLTAAAKLFFKRPGESRKLLGACLAGGLNDSDQDVHDRALLYYRLLKQDVSTAQGVIAGDPNEPQQAMPFFTDELPQEAQQAIFDEFNTLSVVYQQPASSFVQSAQYHTHHADEYEAPGDAAAEAAGAAGSGAAAAGDAASLLVDPSTNLLNSVQQQEADLLDLGDDAPSSVSSSAGGAAAPAAAAAGLGGLLDDDGLGGLDSLMGGLGGLGGSSSSNGLGQQQQQQLQLSPGFKLMPGVFQERWRGLGPAEQYVDSLNMATVAALAANGHKDFCGHVGQANVYSMACGGAAPMYKYYFYAQDGPSQGLFFVEMVVATESRHATITIKSDAPQQLLQQFVEMWKAVLLGFYR